MKKFAIAGAIVLLLAACSGGGLGDLGGILGSPSSQQSSDIRGTVVSLDTNAQRINMNVYQVNQLQTSQSNASIYYDNNTVVYYQNQQYRVTDLERGDEISVTGANYNGRYVASRIDVTRNVRG